MPLTVNCGQCQFSLRVPDHLAGKKISCPKCKAVLQVPSEQPQFAAHQLAHHTAQTSGDIRRRDNTVAPAEVKEATKLNNEKFYEEIPQVLRDIAKIGGLALAVFLVVSAGIYLVFSLLGFAGTTSRAFAEFADIMEQAATAMENARDPSQRAAAAQQLRQQAQRLETWVSTYAHKK
ncbi:MAG: hypothetical protein NZ914_07980 [Gemmatales bacterium]|nr:hypothetical protein [Gemmatales bacterium]